MAETEAFQKIMTATEPADVAQMALIECVRQIADNGKQTNRLLEGMQAEVRDVRERVIRIEASELQADIAELKTDSARSRSEAAAERAALRTRIEKLETRNAERDAERTGARNTGELIHKWGPFAIAIITALFIVLVATGRLVL